MDHIHSRFATTDPVFYDVPRWARTDAADAFRAPGSDAWDGWSMHQDESWTLWRPDGIPLPEQGWKIHASATADSADAILGAVSEHCHAHRIAFKFLRGRSDLARSLSKDADRAGAGKFVTIYPSHQHELHETLLALDERIGGLAGPYILSDLRWEDGPLFVRYGAFVPQTVVEDGADVPAIRDLRDGRLVPDVRSASFSVPEWTSLPSFLEQQSRRLDLAPPPGFPRVIRALQHSNAGGVYEAELDGERIVLKEARPFAGWTPDGRDALARIRDEEDLLRSLPEVPVPRVVSAFDAHGHRFLALERIEGTTLSEAVVQRSPLTRADADASLRRDYRTWARTISAALGDAVDALHRSGRAHGDLHPGNVLITPDDEVVLIDLEMSRPLDDEGEGMIGVPGFVPRDGRRGAARDLYALACIEVSLFLPLTPLFGLHDDKAAEIVRTAAAEFDLDGDWVRERLRILSPTRRPQADEGDSAPAPGSLADLTARALQSDAGAGGGDRVWPGDPAQFDEPSYSLAHGSLGVWLALDAARRGIPPTARQSLERALTEEFARAPRPGLLDGLAGAVWACRRLGLDLWAERLLARLRLVEPERVGSDLASGLAGLGLTLLSESAGDPLLRDATIGIAALLEDRWASVTPARQVRTSTGGLLRGATGTALFALRLFEQTGDPRHLALARTAVEHDLVSLTRADDGSLQVDEGWRSLPYLGHGSAGIGAVLVQLAPHLPDGLYDAEIAGIARAACTPFVIQSGLFAGRAGLIQFLLLLEAHGRSTPATTAAVERHVAQLGLHALPAGDGIRFVGDGLLRASCDLATGAAGVLSACVAHRSSRTGSPPAWYGIPFLDSPRPADVPTRMWHSAVSRGGEHHGLSPVSAGA